MGGWLYGKRSGCSRMVSSREADVAARCHGCTQQLRTAAPAGLTRVLATFVGVSGGGAAGSDPLAVCGSWVAGADGWPALAKLTCAVPSLPDPGFRCRCLRPW